MPRSLRPLASPPRLATPAAWLSGDHRRKIGCTGLRGVSLSPLLDFLPDQDRAPFLLVGIAFVRCCRDRQRVTLQFVEARLVSPCPSGVGAKFRALGFG